jgi:hypothetical protein
VNGKNQTGVFSKNEEIYYTFVEILRNSERLREKMPRAFFC